MLDLPSIVRMFDFPSLDMGRFKRHLNENGITWLSCCAFEQWLRQPVMFEPTAIMTKEMGQVEVTLAPTDFKLSYPSILIKHPTTEPSYSLVSDITVKGCRIMMICHTKKVPDALGGRYSFTMALDGNGRFLDGGKGSTIEEIILHKKKDLPPEQADTWELNRVCINTCLLLASHPTVRERSPRQKEWLKIAKGADRTKAIAAKEKLKLQPQLIVFVNSPILSRQATGADSGATVRPHWRKGHWRCQPCGEGWKDRKIIFIERLYVHGDRGEGSSEIRIVGHDK